MDYKDAYLPVAWEFLQSHKLNGDIIRCRWVGLNLIREVLPKTLAAWYRCRNALATVTLTSRSAAAGARQVFGEPIADSH